MFIVNFTWHNRFRENSEGEWSEGFCVFTERFSLCYGIQGRFSFVGVQKIFLFTKENFFSPEDQIFFGLYLVNSSLLWLFSEGFRTIRGRTFPESSGEKKILCTETISLYKALQLAILDCPRRSFFSLFLLTEKDLLNQGREKFDYAERFSLWCKLQRVFSVHAEKLSEELSEESLVYIQRDFLFVKAI